MSAPKNEPLALTCQHCEASVQLIGDFSAVDVDMVREDWNAEHANCGASAELAHWTAMTEATPRVLAGLEEIVGPRPTWAVPYNDRIGPVPSYGSEPARVHLRLHGARSEAEEYDPAFVSVSARLRHILDGGPVVSMTTHKFLGGEWCRRGSALTPTEARELAALLFAAADLAESEPQTLKEVG